MTSLPAAGPALAQAVRPRQWTKNLVVLAAPAFAGELDNIDSVVRTLLTVVLFTFAASAVYLVNDVLDVVEDRAHPTKRLRPIAAGRLAPRIAVGVAVLLMIVATGLSLALSWQLAVVVASYCLVNVAYSLVLKDEPVIDIAVIALGFLLRAVAGGVACGIDLSQWFLLIASFGSLYMAAGKRYAELHLEVEEGSVTRPSLSRYSATYLRFVWSTSAALLIMSYSLWAFEISVPGPIPWTELSMAPFVLAVLRYAVDVDAGVAGEPEEIALSDRVLQSFAVIWAAMIVLAIYG
ncbi:decaprenyl-phosphate phosphoribosyltransferase [Nocardioides sp. cx-173]|uniref:decaprenyl-phosphate phosphoribosyltransferase n=1 Tax=Nocardioides sp. cx-173 TaxID=2898796 RepID=UPI001E6507E6|nr:decaprenyl-phosphate phosphoribosyltransferase [Nocardioides sp. cx-173]MCD4526410.1 decaprenyl-phosphate phosphoribosyltransferase [Nocardioides sp. cx-173]UGB43580.1 decaprenyl-phosphate phosphoribosyltransferase [Nocardioides sp. cx-173]